MRFIRSKYRVGCRYWEITVLVRKAALISITENTPNSYNSTSTNMKTLSVIFAVLILHNLVMPYEDHVCNLMESSVLTISTVILLLTCYLLAPDWTHLPLLS